MTLGFCVLSNTKFRHTNRSSFFKKGMGSRRLCGLGYQRISLVLLEGGLMRKGELEAVSRYLRKLYKACKKRYVERNKGRVMLFFRHFRHWTRRSGGHRMGGGKGKIVSWYLPLRKGSILFSVVCTYVSLAFVRFVFGQVQFRLSLSSRVVCDYF
jgi:ribosomal protein L16/L10AE